MASALPTDADVKTIPCLFAENGDKSVPVNESQKGVSFRYGFPLIYSKLQAEGGRVVKREDFNSFFYVISNAVLHQQCGGIVSWNRSVCEAISGYPVGARLWWKKTSGSRSDFVLIESQVGDNTVEPTSDTVGYGNESTKPWKQVTLSVDTELSDTSTLPVAGNAIKKAIDDHDADTDKHVTQEEKNKWNAGVDLANLLQFFPVGSLYVTTDPNATVCPLQTLFEGTVWVRVCQGMCIWGSDGTHVAGTEIAAGLPALSVSVGTSNIPYSVSEAGNHSHGGGTLDIVGEFSGAGKTSGDSDEKYSCAPYGCVTPKKTSTGAYETVDTVAYKGSEGNDIFKFLPQEGWNEEECSQSGNHMHGSASGSITTSVERVNQNSEDVYGKKNSAVYDSNVQPNAIRVIVWKRIEPTLTQQVRGQGRVYEHA